jgi:hypothetical protein
MPYSIPLNQRVQLRRDTSANWTSGNPVLKSGEIGYETDTKQLKIGDSATYWADLAYFASSEVDDLPDLGDVTITNVSNGDYLRWNGTAWVNDPINLGSDTTGSYVSSIVAGTGITLTNNSGEGATPTVAVDVSTIQAKVSGVTDTEIGYLDGVTSAIQTQLDNKQAIVANVSNTEIGHLDGVTSAIQTQLDTIVDYSITNSGSGAYLVNGVSNGIIHFKKGKKYKVSINASGHPFWIQTVSGAYSSGNVYSTGITNGGTQSGMIFVELPQNAPDTLYYACQYHSSMAGSISTLSIEPDVKTQLDTKAPLASPTLTGSPLAPTQTAGDNTTKIATTAFVTSAVASVDAFSDQFFIGTQIWS